MKILTTTHVIGQNESSDVSESVTRTDPTNDRYGRYMTQEGYHRYRPARPATFEFLCSPK